MKRDAVSAKLVMIMNLLATPLRTSIEFMVLPVTGIMKIISAIYSSGILTNPKRGKERWGLYAPSKIIGIADIARATGLNQPQGPYSHLSEIGRASCRERLKSREGKR